MSNFGVFREVSESDHTHPTAMNACREQGTTEGVYKLSLMLNLINKKVQQL